MLTLKNTMAKSKKTNRNNNVRFRENPDYTGIWSWLHNINKGIFPFILIGGIILAVYSQSLFFDFTDFDDSAFVADGFTQWADVLQHLRTSIANDLYRPLFFATITVNNLIFGATPLALHAGNILIHIVVALLVFMVLKQTFYHQTIALSGALIFAVHPLNVQAVAWIPGRNDTFLALLFILTFFTLPRNDTFKISPNVLLILHFVLFCAALFVKETAVIFPFIACLYLWAEKKSFRSSQTILYICIWLIALVAYGLCRIYTESAPIHRSFLFQHVYAFDALHLNWQTLPALIGKMLIPVNLSGYAGFNTTSTITGLIVLSGLIAMMFFPSINKRRYTFWLGWVLCVVALPMLRHQIRIGEFDYLEHRSYLAMPAFLGLLYELFSVVSVQKRKFGGYLILPVIVLFLFQTNAYNKNFSDAPTFWHHALLSHPQSAVAYATLGQYSLRNEGASPRTEEFFTRAVQYAPSDVRYWTFLGLLHGQQGKILQAEQDLLRGYSHDSTYPDLLYNLGYAIYLRHNKADSVYTTVIHFYQKALYYDNRHRNTYLNIIGICFNHGDFQQAWKYFLQAQERGLNLETDKPGLRNLLQSKLQ